MPNSIPYTVNIALYEREYRKSLQKLYDTLSVKQMALVKQFTIDRDWLVHNPEFGRTWSLTVGDFEPVQDK